MPAPLSRDLRARIVEAVEGGSSMRGAAARFAVSPSSAIKLMARVRATGSLAPARYGGHRRPWPRTKAHGRPSSTTARATRSPSMRSSGSRSDPGAGRIISSSGKRARHTLRRSGNEPAKRQLWVEKRRSQFARPVMLVVCKQTFTERRRGSRGGGGFRASSGGRSGGLAANRGGRDRISLRRSLQERKIRSKGPGIRGMSA
jgi:hypothetical protein